MLKIALISLTAVAVGLVALAFWSAHLAREAERRFPPLGRFVETGGLRLHHAISGREDGVPVVLLHGANSAMQDWEHGVRTALERDFRVIAFDRPGHGYSEPMDEEPTPAAQARVMRAALRQLGIERPIVVGFSWSGAIATAWGLDAPDEVAAVVTLAGATHDWPGDIDAVYQLAAWPFVGWLFAHTIVPVYAHAFADSLSADVFWPQPLGGNLDKLPIPLAVRPRAFLVNAAERRLLKPFLAIQKLRYPSFRPPLVVVHGMDDRIVGLSVHSRPLHGAVPHSRLMEIAAAGHALPYTHAATIAEAVRRAADDAETAGRIRR